MYERNYKKSGSKNSLPVDPLLYVPSHTDRVLKIDLEAAGIPANTPKGKLDFHACRVAYINLLLESGDVSAKEVQELARHSTSDLTMNVYGRVREDRLAAAVERVGSRILQRKSVPSVYRLVAGADTKNATLVESEGCICQKLVAAEGLEPSLAEKQKTASSEQNSAKSQQINALEGEAKRSDMQSNAETIHLQNTSERQKCVPGVYRNMPTDLAQVVAAWENLDVETRRKIVAMIGQE